MDDPCDEWFMPASANIRARPSGFSWPHRLFTITQIGIAVWIAWLWFHLPSPGWAVAILAGVAAAMSIHGDMRGWQKAIWMALIGCLLIVELKSISKDRADSDARAAQDHTEQEERFKKIRDAQDAEFKETASGLNSAIAGIESTLAQTHPHAEVHFSQAMSFSGGLPTELRPGTSYVLKSDVMNDGNEEGIILRKLRRVYIGKPDDRQAQEALGLILNGPRPHGALPELIVLPRTSAALTPIRIPLRMTTSRRWQRVRRYIFCGGWSTPTPREYGSLKIVSMSRLTRENWN